jgi:hypothetical protein
MMNNADNDLTYLPLNTAILAVDVEREALMVEVG